MAVATAYKLRQLGLVRKPCMVVPNHLLEQTCAEARRYFPAMRGLFILPMMATPVAIALVWTMMFHPQLGVLNYLLPRSSAARRSLGLCTRTVIPSLVMVETWQWTPLVMLIVLGGLAAFPIEPYESARIDGASDWQMFRHITCRSFPFLMIAAIIRPIDAIKTFDIIFVITQGGPGTASETINLYLYPRRSSTTTSAMGRR